jgi:hypothetical protein
MEEDIFKALSSQSSLTKKMEKIEVRLKEAVDIAEERQSYDSAHDEELLNALTVVADFIRRKKRVCYGGTAMNAILPKSKRFYNPDFDLPDYDFYTPDIEKDVEDLVADLTAAGFKDVYHRVGIHEGTKKILVNFVAVADVSRIETDLYDVFYKRSIVKEGIHYTDPDILRMMMYLEISRPKGQVARWQKVFERLQLINQVFPVKAPQQQQKVSQQKNILSAPIQEVLINFIVGRQRILCNGPVLPLYKKGIRKGSAIYKAYPSGPMLFTSPAPKEDALLLKRLLKSSEGDVSIFLHKARGEIVPERFELRVDDKIICLIIQEVACHSYNNIPLEDGRVIQIGSLEFLVTLYLSLHIFTKHSRDILGPNAMHAVGQCIQLAMENYLSERSQFPPFSLNCTGHQIGYASLIRQKVQRIKKERGEAPGAEEITIMNKKKKTKKAAKNKSAKSKKKGKKTKKKAN